MATVDAGRGQWIPLTWSDPCKYRRSVAVAAVVPKTVSGKIQRREVRG